MTTPTQPRLDPRHVAVAALLGAAFLFGITFVVVKDAVSAFPPLAFIGWRFALGAVALGILALPRGGRLWRDGIIAGTFLFCGYAFQTVGLTLTGASTSALITGLYVVFTPLLVAVVSRRAPSPWVLVGTVIAFIGLALVTVRDDVVLGTGDLLTLVCALGFAAHITYLAVAAPRHPVVPFTTVQLITTAVLGLATSAVLEAPLQLPTSREWPAIALTGLGVSALAYLLQVWAQTRVEAGTVAVVLTTEPVFGVAMGALLLGERLTAGGWVGALLILGAIELVVVRGSPPETTEAEAVSPAG